MREIITIVFASIVSFFNSISIMPHISRPSPSPIAIVSPAPKQPSEKALKIASYLLLRANISQKLEIKKKYGNIDTPDTEIIRVWAYGMDNDSALMAQYEAIVQRNQMRDNSLNTNDTNSVGDTNETLCQKSTIKYQDCMNEYTKKLGDYTECIAGYSESCIKPYSFCVKPNCVQ